MDEFTNKLAGKLGARTSRGAFLRVAGGSALGLALGLNGVSLASAQCSPPCGGCDGGACDSPYPACSSGCPQGAGCPSGYTAAGWICCTSCCKWSCYECCNGSTYCHCFYNSNQSCGGCSCAVKQAA